MRTTKTIIIVESDGTIFCNDPDLEPHEISKLPNGKITCSRPSEIIYVKYGSKEECGCCGAYHRPKFAGDCRTDNERFYLV